jgi:hypothetical protein
MNDRIADGRSIWAGKVSKRFFFKKDPKTFVYGGRWRR